MLVSMAMEPIMHPITNLISFIANLPCVAPVRPRTTDDLTFGASKSGRHDEAEPLGRCAEPLHGMLGERHSPLAGGRDAALGLLARQAHRHALAQRRVGLATLGEIIHLLEK